MSDEYVPQPLSMSVDYERKPVLYLPGGKCCVRQAGFVPAGIRSMQTTGTFPQLTTPKKTPKKGGKRGK